MKKILISLVAVLLALVTLCAPLSVSASLETVKWISPEDYVPAIEDYEYSFAIIGDTQILVREDGGDYAANKYDKPTNYTEQLYDWLLDNVEEKKIAYVMGLGDICEMSYNANEWKVAQEQILRMNGVVPYSLVRGNHDDKIWFTREMGVENPEYVASIEGSHSPGREATLNNYRTLRVGGVSYLIMVLDYYPTDEVLEWANEVIAAHPHHRVIITTHAYMFGYLSHITNYDKKYAPHGGNCGRDIWNKLVKYHENIFMVISGHVGADGIVASTRKGKNGNKVYEVLIDPQSLDEEYVRERKEDPTGLVAMFYFSKDGTKIGLEYYSTIRDVYVKLDKQILDVPEYNDVLGEPETTVPETTVPETTITTQPETPYTPDTTAAEIKSGCQNSVGAFALPLVIGSGAVAVVVSKKRKRK